MKLNEKLYQLRKKNGLTQTDVAEKLGISRQAVSRWEIGVAVPSLENIKILSELFGVPVENLLPGNNGSEETYAGETTARKLIRKGNNPALLEEDNQTISSLDSQLADVEGKAKEKEILQKTEDFKIGLSTGHDNGAKAKKLVCILVTILLLLILIALGIGLGKFTSINKGAWLYEMKTDSSEQPLGTDFQLE
jgi:transcriptional regulator with XRE-family HTH domain